jgi:predicted DNA-binding WGR domain protein
MDPVAEAMLPGGSVIVVGTDVYEAHLEKVDGRKKIKTFLSIQLICVPKKGRKAQSFNIFSRTGEEGSPGVAEVVAFPSLGDAVTEFEAVFQSNTGNDWTARASFAPKRGKFNLAAGPPAAAPPTAAPAVADATSRRGRSAAQPKAVSPPPSPKAKRGKKLAALPPGAPPLVSTPSTTQAGCIDATALTLLPDADVVVHGGDVYDVALSQIDISKNMDKYYIIQLLSTPNAGRRADTFYVFVRWGRTGATGQHQLHGAYDTLEEAIEVFEEKFEEKTKNQWSDRHSFKAKKGHYDLIRVDHAKKANRRLGKGPAAKWEYYVDDHVDGKTTGWYAYTKEGTEDTEDLWVTYQSNPHMSQRVVESGTYSYLVDLVKMTQTNTSHPARKVRNIRREFNGVVTQGTPTPGATSITVSAPATTSLFAPPVPAPVAVAPAAPAPVVKAAKAAKVPAAPAAAAPSPSGPTVRPVDSHCPLSHQPAVQVVDDYDIMLNQADIKANKNKFYRLQLLYNTANRTYSFWTRWGRVGEGGQNNLDNCGGDKNSGISAFKKKFKVCPLPSPRPQPMPSTHS